jgi:hypothetical protein
MSDVEEDSVELASQQVFNRVDLSKCPRSLFHFSKFSHVAPSLLGPTPDLPVRN